MNIILYKSKCERNVINKLAYLTQLLTMDGTMRNGLDVDYPSIDIDISDATTRGDILSANYVYISDFNKYYYVLNRYFTLNNILTIELEIDLLYTFKNTISNSVGYVARNENTYNDDIVDDLISYELTPNITEYEIPNQPVNATPYNIAFKSRLYVDGNNEVEITYDADYGEWEEVREYYIPQGAAAYTIKPKHVHIKFQRPASVSTRAIVFFNSTNVVRSQYNNFGSIDLIINCEPYLQFAIYCDNRYEVKVEYIYETEFDVSNTNQINNIVTNLITTNGYVSDGSKKSNPYLCNDVLDPITEYNTQGACNNICTLLLNNANFNLTYNKLTSSNTLASFFLNFKIYPFIPSFNIDVEQSTALTNTVYIGTENVGVYGIVPNTKAEYIFHKRFTIPYNNNFMDYEPYRKVELYIPYHSWITLDTKQLKYATLVLIYYVNYTGGDNYVMLVDVTHSKLIYSSACNIGIDIPITSTNEYELKREKQALTNNYLTQLGLSLGTTAVGVASGNILALGGGVASSIKTTSSYINTKSTMFESANAVIMSGTQGIANPQNARLRITTAVPTQTINNTNYKHVVGKPFNEVVALSGVTGYSVITDIRNDNITDNITANEFELLKRLLADGVIL